MIIVIIIILILYIYCTNNNHIKSTLKGNSDLKGYVPPFSNVEKCDYHDTGLCTLKDEKCKAPIQCMKDEIVDGNQNNGNLVPNAYEDKAITKDSERNVKGDTLEYSSSWNIFQKAYHSMKAIVEIVLSVILIIIGILICLKLQILQIFTKLLCCYIAFEK